MTRTTHIAALGLCRTAIKSACQCFRSEWTSSLFTRTSTIFALEPHKGPHARKPSAGSDAYTPGQMHDRKVTLVNLQFLTFVCLRAHVLVDAAMPCWDAARGLARGQEEIERALESVHTFPWAALARFQAPNFLSDIVGSLLGAVYLDSNGDMDALEWRVAGDGGKISCALVVEGIELTSAMERYNGKASKDDVRFRVAEKGIKILLDKYSGIEVDES
ncbi:hypothetical protein DFH11DRAFT_1544287 [Phellopilus nigrolimitatus]|nr:hypothetical protein DFH11DRAFT_1544287 [Phellopilus nigrolimitatus]